MNSLQQFLAMGGYASYVWSAYGIAALILLGNVGLALHTKRTIKRKLRKHFQFEKQSHAS